MPKALAYPDYPEFIAALKQRVVQARTSAIRAVNRDLILLYWDIGCAIVEKQRSAGWGDAVVERLAADLRREFPDMKGFSSRNVWDMRRLYDAYSEAAFLSQVVREVSRESKARVCYRLLQNLLGALNPRARHL